MKLVADENVDHAVVKALRALGHEVWSVAEEAHSVDDDEVLRIAVSMNALLLTSDKDFGELVFRQGRATAGVFLLRLAGLSATRKAELVSDAVDKHGPELNGSFSVLTEYALRIRAAGERG